MQTNWSLHPFLIILALCYPISGFSSLAPHVKNIHVPSKTKSQLQYIRIPRGGFTSEDKNAHESIESGEERFERVNEIVETPKNMQLASLAFLSPITTLLQCAGSSYSNALVTYPILTKSLTAGTTFLLSDYTAQSIERQSENKDEGKGSKHDWTRTLVSAAVGLFYFGPAAHAWYEMIFKLLPGTSLFSTLQKAILGQLIFGPAFTCVFFATSLMQGGTFSLGSWVSKIKSDLPGAWLAGVGFWPLVDFVSYALVPIKFIPLFINLCSFVWTIYLSMVANRNSNKK